MGDTKLNLEQYQESYRKTYGAIYVMSKLSAEMKAVDSAFKAYLDNPNDNFKSDAEKVIKKWKDSKDVKCVEEVRKGADLISNIEFTLNTHLKKALADAVQLPEPPAFINGKFTCYRGDERLPAAIKLSGFDLWPEAKAVIKAGVQSYFQHTAFAHYVDVPGGSGSKGWADYARASKNRGRPTISTSLGQGCGGYDSGPIYKMEIDGLTEDTMTPAVMGIPVPWKDPLRLYLDKPTLAEATIVGVNLNLSTWEVVFMTFVDPKFIKKVKLANGKTFDDL